MKKHRKLLAVILSIAMILTLVPLALFASAEDEYVPYINTDTNTVNKEDGNYTISSVTELKWLSTTVNAGTSYANSNFKLTADLDLSGTSWTPIGSSAEKAFSGTFDGDGHTVTGLTFGTADSRNNRQSAGLFGYVDQGTIQNLAVKDSEFYMTGLLAQVGPIVASLDEGTVIGCAVSDVVIDVEYTNTEVFTLNAVGGLVGASTGGTISESYSTAHIAVTAPVSIGNYVGGLVGRNNGTLANAYYAGNVSLGESLIGHVGGLVGNNAGTIENAYSVGLVGGKLTAGIAGLNTGAITNCYYYEGSAAAGSYKTEDNKTYTADETNITTFNNSTYTLVSAFATDLNGTSILAGVTGAFTGLNDATEDLTGTNNYPFPVLKNNPFSDDMENPAENTTDFAGGNGTIYNPYRIATPAHFNNVRNFLSDAFILSDDIVFADYMYLTKDENIVALKAALSDDDIAAITAIVNGTTEEETTTTTTQNSEPGAQAEGDESSSSTSETESSSATSEESTTQAGGEGGTTPPAENVDLSTLDISTLTADQIADIEDIIGDIDVLQAGAFVNGFAPIGAIADPFVGNFDGNGKTIYNIQIESTGTYAALFVRNLGTIADLEIDQTVNQGSTVKYADVATKPASVTLTTAGTSGAYAAAVAARNNGTIANAEVDVDVTVVSDAFKAYVAGLVADNTGTVKDSANSGVILAKFSDAAYTGTYKDIAENADIKVAGAVAVNKTGAVVDGCDSNASARSEFTSASTTDGIVEADYIADDQVETTAAAAGTANPSDEYLTYTVPASYTRPSTAYTAESGISDLNTGASLVNATGTLAGVAEYSELADNYQLVTIKYNDTYTTSFLAWVQLDVEEMTADTSKADKEFLKGEAFSSDGIKVTAQGEEGAISLSEVADDGDNGYVVKVYSKTEAAEGGEATYTEITDLSTQPAGTYYVKITYGGQEIPNSEYTIRVCDITSIEITADYTTYMVDQAPVLDVTAIYDDTAKTKKILDEYDFYLAESDEAFKSADFAGTPAEKFTETADKVYVGVIDGNVKSNTVEVKVLARDVKVTNLAKTTSADQTTETATADKVKTDNIKLTWTDADAPQYRVYRSADGGTNWIRKSSPKTDYYTDSTSISGESYKYKVVMVIAGEESEGAAEIDVTAPIPEKTSADITKATRYVGLYNDFRSGSVKVTGTYKNGTSETIGSAADAEKAKKSKYYFDTSALNSSVPGEYEIGIMFNGAKVNEIVDNKTVVDAYKVTVVPPTAITAAADYTYYPIGYDAETFKDTLTVKASYPEGTISGTTTVDSEDFTTTYVAENVTTEGEQTIVVKYASFEYPAVEGSYAAKELTADVKVTFVPNVAPATVSATAGATGINTVTFSDVTGAVSYNVYRAGTDGIYELIGEVADVAETTTYTYDDENAAPNAVYTYKVAAVIADQETPHSAVTDAITTVAPKYIKAAFGEKFVTEYAVGQSLKTTEITVKAYYSKDGYTPAADDADFAGLESNTNYTSRELTKNKKSDAFNYYYTTDYDKATAGEYTVHITYAGAKEYNGVAIGSKTVTVYPIYKLTAETKETKYQIGYDFTNDDLKVTATYGDATAKPEFKVATLSSDDFVMLDEPDMSVAGSQVVTVALASNTDVRTTIDVLVYDPDKLIDVKDNSAYVDDTENNYITNIQPATTVATLKTNLENDATTIQVVDKNGNALTRDNLATGDKVQLVAGDTVLDERVIVVLGDANGDATVNILDLLDIVNHMSNNSLEGPYKKAANTSGTSETIDILDVLQVINYM